MCENFIINCARKGCGALQRRIWPDQFDFTSRRTFGLRYAGNVKGAHIHGYASDQRDRLVSNISHPQITQCTHIPICISYSRYGNAGGARRAIASSVSHIIDTVNVTHLQYSGIEPHRRFKRAFARA